MLFQFSPQSQEGRSELLTSKGCSQGHWHLLPQKQRGALIARIKGKGMAQTSCQSCPATEKF